MRLLFVLMACLAALPSAGVSQSVYVASYHGAAVVADDADALARATCRPDAEAVVLELELGLEPRGGFSTEFHGPLKTSITVRRGNQETENAIHPVDAQGRPVKKNTDLEFDRRNFSGFIRGCLAQDRFVFKQGQIELSVHVLGYRTKLTQSFKALAANADASFRLSYQSTIFETTGAAFEATAYWHYRRKGLPEFEGQASIGEVAIRLSDFPVRFLSDREDRSPMEGTLGLNASFLVFDGRETDPEG